MMFWLGVGVGVMIGALYMFTLFLVIGIKRRR